MILQGWPQLGFIAGIALQNPKPAYDAPIHLREPHLPTELGLLTCLAPPNYGRVLLEDGNQLLRGRNLLPFKHLRRLCEMTCSRSPAKWESSSGSLREPGASWSILCTRSACFIEALATSINLS